MHCLNPPLWRTLDGFCPYVETVQTMTDLAMKIACDGDLSEEIWLLQHPPLYTRGTSSVEADLIEKNRFPVHDTGRGGQFTYHGPGQRVIYVMLDLKRRTPDIRLFIKGLEGWIQSVLAHFGVAAGPRQDRIGLWVDTAFGEKKIAAIGVRVHKWVTYHGVAFNVHPDLSHFSGIIPCGLSGYGVTSLWDLGLNVSLDDVDLVLKQKFVDFF